MKNKKFSDYIQHILNFIEEDFTAEQDRIRNILKEKAD